MDILQNVVQYILDLGAAVFVPFLMFIIALCMRMKVRDAFISALTLGIAFTGMNLLVNFIMTSMGAAANDLANNTGLSLPAVDIGWPGAASITWAWPYAFLMFPVQIGINVVLLLLNQTKTLNVDLWNVWNKIFSAVLVSYFTNNVFYGFCAAAILIVLELKLGDVFAPEVERLTGIPGVTVPHFICLIAVILFPIDELLKRVPGLNKEFNADNLKEKIGVFGENAVMGSIIGFLLGLASGNGFKFACTLAVQAATALQLFPMVSKLFAQSLSPISEAVSEFMRKKFKNREVYIGLDWPILGGRNELWVAVIFTMVFLLGFSITLPGNIVLPFAGIVNLSFVVGALLLTNGNVLRMIIHGFISAPLFLYGATYFTPYMTKLAQESGTLDSKQNGLISWATFEGPDLRYMLTHIFSGDILAFVLFACWIVLLVLLIRNRKKYNQSFIDANSVSKSE
ncbi:PTS galactitol transporter subunit IIC [Enterococcus faecalis]|uniref:PTS galactitol transporter subunit IIC n=1 Tax=Enterococcus faecalis TaxID=1351 RepID=A0ABD7IVS6_ENTFL|nr:PTS transporter subunit IIC [Enterococcus faecalis]EGO2744179.1 PTS galactitol transporter subunit IIC [Enterococcus faecalis]EGO2804339.1 PTS galactitol transporter subunit IIC [Enterococcus faecalis]EGO2813074.1 PTS galactitol transporter subunit IIC [Enterococcus faecalis]EGO2832003.1 PTS galactitol transporter subunit IIC [Enterococcus faecalis]EGO5088532.1 PTS galactitol transporter subunit IIC [Enterococcus faecalis]